MIFFAIALTLLLIAVLYFDITQFIIPNTISIIIIALWPIFVLTYPLEVNWTMSLAVMLGVFLFGLLIFTLNLMGGGDVKLFTALSLWIGWKPYILFQFFTWIAIAGGILALFKIIVKLSAKKMKKEKHLPHFLKVDKDIPYGLAIVFSFLFLLWKQAIFII